MIIIIACQYIQGTQNYPIKWVNLPVILGQRCNQSYFMDVALHVLLISDIFNLENNNHLNAQL